MKIKLAILTTILALTSSCGFKVVDQDFLGDYSIVEANITGEPKIAYLIRKKIRKEDATNLNAIKIDIATKKQKSISEKNIQNEITRYEITIKTDVKVFKISSNNMIEFSIVRSGDYDVDDRNTTTLNNEKNLIKNLVNKITDQIYQDLKMRINDF